MAAYEIDFLRVGDGASSGDAIALRYWDDGQWRVGVVDGGYETSGEELCEHIGRIYQSNHVDFAVSTHPDNDHMSGLRVVLRQMSVGQLWMHVPWLHAARILPLFRGRRWTVEGLIRELRVQYPYVHELIELASNQGTQLQLPFLGASIGPFTVISPSVAMYEKLLPQFRDTPMPDADLLQSLGAWLTVVGRRTAGLIRRVIRESWEHETLREGGTTAAENEPSVVLLGNFNPERVLLTGDAGLVALSAAIHYAQQIGRAITNLSVFQVPHHGSRNNVSPSIFNALIGPPLVRGRARPTTCRCVISAGAEDTEHRRRVVVNALLRRGLSPVTTKGGTLRVAGGGMPDRPGWNAIAALPFETLVEQYD